MSFDWRNYLKLAEYLYLNIDSEAACRTGISRAYYSVLCAAKVFCLNEKILSLHETRGSQVHRNVINSLIDHQERDFVKIGKKLETLREKRNDADYDSFKKGLDKKELCITIEMSKDIFTMIEDLHA